MDTEHEKERCNKWLREYLGGKVIPCEIVKAEAERLGYSRQELKQARQDLGVVSEAITSWRMP